MENEETVLEEETSPADLSELEEQLSNLVEVLEEEQRIELEEKEALEKEQLENEEKLLQDEEIISVHQENVLSLQETETENSSLILLELQTLNENIVLQNEKVDDLTDITVESGFMITLSIAIVMSIKIFIDQISKW